MPLILKQKLCQKVLKWIRRATWMLIFGIIFAFILLQSFTFSEIKDFQNSTNHKGNLDKNKNDGTLVTERSQGHSHPGPKRDHTIIKEDEIQWLLGPKWKRKMQDVWSTVEYSAPSWNSTRESDFLLATKSCFIIPPEKYLNKLPQPQPQQVHPFPKFQGQTNIASSLTFRRGKRIFLLENKPEDVNCSIHTIEIPDSIHNASKGHYSIVKSKMGLPPRLQSFFYPSLKGATDFLVECTAHKNKSTMQNNTENKAIKDLPNTPQQGEIVYHNYHPIVRITKALSAKLPPWTSRENLNEMPPDIIIVALDALSRSTMANQLPRVHKGFSRAGFIDIKGFTAFDRQFMNSEAGWVSEQEPEAVTNQTLAPENLNSEQKWVKNLFKKLDELNYATFYGEDSEDLNFDPLVDVKVNYTTKLHKLNERALFENELNPTYSVSKLLRASQISQANEWFHGSQKEILLDYTAELVPFLSNKHTPLAVFLKISAHFESRSRTHAEILSQLDRQLQWFFHKVLSDTSSQSTKNKNKKVRKKYLIVFFSLQSQGNLKQKQNQNRENQAQNGQKQPKAPKKVKVKSESDFDPQIKDNLVFEKLTDDRLPILHIKLPHGLNTSKLTQNSLRLSTPSDLWKTIVGFASNETFSTEINSGEKKPTENQIERSTTATVDPPNSDPHSGSGSGSSSGSSSSSGSTHPVSIKRSDFYSYNLALKTVPQERSCASAGISKHLCPCGHDPSFNPRSNPLSAQYISRLAVDKMNQDLSNFSRKCAKMTFAGVNDMTLQLRGLQVDNRDSRGKALNPKTSRKWPRNGHFKQGKRPKNAQNLKSKTTNNSTIVEFIRIRFRTEPNRALYSIVIKFNVDRKSFSFRNRPDWVLRVDPTDPLDYECLTVEGANGRKHRKIAGYSQEIQGKSTVTGVVRNEGTLTAEGVNKTSKAETVGNFKSEEYFKTICYCLDADRGGHWSQLYEKDDLAVTY